VDEPMAGAGAQLSGERPAARHHYEAIFYSTHGDHVLVIQR
jgi:hypothetical protein